MWVTYSVVAILLLWALAMGVVLKQKDWQPPEALPLWDGVRSPLKDVPTTDLRAMIGFSKTLTALPVFDPRDGQWKVIQPSEEEHDAFCFCRQCLDRAAEAGAVVKQHGDGGVINYFFVGDRR